MKMRQRALPPAVAHLVLVRPMRAPYPQILRALLVAACMCGCASEEQRYHANRIDLHVSSRTKALLSATDIDEIARLMAHASRMQMICISTTSPRIHPNAFEVVTGYSWGENPSEFQSQFGLYYVRRDQGTWHILEGGPGLSGVLVGLACEDPPK
jgi:hypothetical protein